MIQKLTRIQTDSIRKKLDSLCTQTHSLRYEHLVDSMLEERINELKHNLDDYRKK